MDRAAPPYAAAEIPMNVRDWAHTLWGIIRSRMSPVIVAERVRITTR
jgi:hypothetical protein